MSYKNHCYQTLFVREFRSNRDRHVDFVLRNFPESWGQRNPFVTKPVMRKFLCCFYGRSRYDSRLAEKVRYLEVRYIEVCYVYITNFYITNLYITNFYI